MFCYAWTEKNKMLNFYSSYHTGHFCKSIYFEVRQFKENQIFVLLEMKEKLLEKKSF